MDFIKLHLTREPRGQWEKPLQSPQAVYEFLRHLIGSSDSENSVALLLDSKGKINAVHHFSQGSLNTTMMHPREAFKAAVLSNANSVIFAHNHPSGDLSPSPEDLEVTKKLIKAGRILGIPVQDHLIVSDSDYYSFRQETKIRFGGKK